MYIKQLITNGFDEAAYYIESEGEAAIIDPLNDIEAYLLLATERKATIKYIFETHFDAAYLSGQIDLSNATKAPIVYGPHTETSFPIHQAKDGEAFSIGKIVIKALHTPGRTIESTCYLLQDENGGDYAAFTGDTLFMGDAGQPISSQGDITASELAGYLYESIQNKIIPLNNEVIVYPAHGSGSSFGQRLDSETFSTIGEQKQTNYALKHQSKEEFIKAVTEGLNKAPNKFPDDARINKEGYKNIDTVLEKALTQLSVGDFKQKMSDNIVVADTRNTHVFSQGFVPGCISIGLEGRFAEWAGNLLPFKKPILLITEPGQEKESVISLSRVGISTIEGYLAGGFEAWQNAGEPIDMIIDIEADELAMDIPFDEKLVVLDVRKEVEFADGHVKGAINMPLANLIDPASMANIDDNDNLYVHCSDGYRSVIALSLLKREGFHNVRNVAGGWAAIKEQPSIETEKDASVLN